MDKIWANEGNNSDKIVAIIGNTIYKCNPRDEDINDYIQSLKMKIIPDKKTFGVPLPYIKEFRYQEGKNYIQIMFGADSEEHFRINEREKRNEIFEYFKSIVPNAISYTDKHTPLQAGKKPLIALLVVSALFIWTWYIAAGIESGNQYQVTGNHYNSFAGIVLMLASLGVNNVFLIFILLMAIAITSFFLKARKPPIIHRVIIKK